MPRNAPAFCTSEAMPVQNVFLPAIRFSGMPCARKVLSSTLESRSKLKKPMPHSPTTPANASSMPTIVLWRQRGIGKQLAHRAHLLLLRLGLGPLLRFLELAEDEDRQQGRQPTHQEHQSPGTGHHADLLHVPEHDANQGGNHVADSRQSLKPAERERPGSIRHRLGDQRHAHRELAAHAEPGERAVDREIPHVSARTRSSR